uniref:Reverse transcriptase domain-containing protein n=1 Tax=Musa acuminata subsp. malaccensis TaxID=214687 RepID=A0A804KMI4_MUSAM|nr:PREDICTED: uncharacterized protein LOC103998947 [Musa acuminata subsp. malaccensis]
MVDTGSSADILYFDAFQKLGLAKEDLTPMPLALTGFTGDSILPLDTVILPVILGEEPRSKNVMMTFIVVEFPSVYNAILGRPTVNKFRAVISTYHRAIKFPTRARVGEVRSAPQGINQDNVTWRPSYYRRDRSMSSPSSTLGTLQNRITSEAEAAEAGSQPTKAVSDEVERLLAAGFIAEAKYPRWLSNIVLVKKPNGSWRMCVDYTDLNRACPKDCYPSPRIDQLVDATSGHELLSFMDAFSGYNQIKMAPEDQEHTAFITHRGVYYYKVMPFGLKNAEATYQRMVNKMFAH